VVISEGKVIEEGNHAQLMAEKGAYHSLVVSQCLSETEDVFTGNLIIKYFHESLKYFFIIFRK
jgi:hypothetical protein